ncbi:cuticle protein-like [Manduca sexta]|uniref:cuticle protein-like n=1 Tax=Manduca sexta TaxID=7130 RepID=UPI001890A2BC|nr:cuticle protein-like [Manduca sexta]
MNSYVAIWCLLALTASTKADGSWGGLVYAPGHASVDYYAYPRYAFEYSVKDPHTGDNKAQWEKRDGDTVRGAYSLVEPGGSIRVVEYWADDKSGFNAVVKRLGPKVHPVAVPAAPIYKAPIPMLSPAPIAPIVPISVGSVAKFGGLANAPLIGGPLYGGALSTASVYKGPAVSIPTPILPAPIIKAPLPIAPAPILPAPILPAPIIKADIGHYPGPMLSGHNSGHILPAPLPVLKGPIGYPLAPIAPWGDGLIKGHMAGPAYLDDLGYGLLSKGSALPAWGPLSYGLGLKH